MPLLRELNPNIATALSKTAKLVSEDEAYLRQLSEEAERKIDKDGELSRTGLAALPAPISSRILHRHLLALDGNVKESDIRRVMALATAKTGTHIELSGGYSAWTDAEWLHIGVYPDIAEYEYPFEPDGDTVTPYGVLTACRTDNWRKPLDHNEAYLDLGALPKALVIRSRRDADRFFPLGAPGERKLSDVFTDRKIPKEERDVPLLCAGNQVYYAAGLGISQHARITPDTREILHIILNRGDRD
jgi:tRNA(Ile)-lysidine synthase